ncbi:hypothetical protein [Micrococcus luteus]|uniref:hypothetical protein n=1 Tax=Micrococcus luteus TaxID=1270 RepID=UPI0023028F19|nr:hypothetical protein [Micrococcus luteus]
MSDTTTVPADFPWPDDDIVDHGIHAGIPWVARRHPADYLGGQVNGYIKLPEDHPWVTSMDYIDTGVPWGEITFHGHNGWVGFDTGHAGQWWPKSDMPRHEWFGSMETEMTDDLAVAWTQLFAANAALAMHGHTFGDAA